MLDAEETRRRQTSGQSEPPLWERPSGLQGMGEGFLEEVAPELSPKGQNLPGQNKISTLTQR